MDVRSVNTRVASPSFKGDVSAKRKSGPWTYAKNRESGPEEPEVGIRIVDQSNLHAYQLNKWERRTFSNEYARQLFQSKVRTHSMPRDGAMQTIMDLETGEREIKQKKNRDQ